jgi:hypothetical protein
MNLSKKLLTILSVSLSLFFFVSPAFAAAPDGLGPWADSVFSVSQGLMKNGVAVPLIRSDTTAALGVAENTPTVDSTFFSLGFGGSIVLGFDNGISSGAMVVEATVEPGYPDETARVEMSDDGITWVMAGNVIQGGTVSKPEQVACAKYVRITDTSNPAIMPDDIADGYDVDGVRATPSLTLTPTPTDTPTPGPTSTPGPGPTSTPGPGPTSTPGPGPTATPTPVIIGSAPCPTVGNPLIPCFPNTGRIGFPNTGFAPHAWNIQAGIHYIFSILLKFFNL